MPATFPSSESVDVFAARAKADPAFVGLLVASLQQARAAAESQLDAALFQALAWPTNVDDYVAYLHEFARWAPQQSGAEAWKKPGTAQHQEVYDRLCHFYWLIDQPVGPNGGIIIENIPWFREWLVTYANAWGSFLNTTESFNNEILASFLTESPQYRVQDSLIDGRPNAPSGWLTFNQFFARELNPGLRPIAAPTDNATVVAPADCTYRAMYAIGPDSRIPEITIKGTHKFASIPELLDGSPYQDAFAGGTFVHYFLGPYSYHRFHTPVAGVVKECRAVQGLVYLDVTLSNGQFDAPDSSEGGYEFSQARGIITLDTQESPFGNIGLVTTIPVGMAQVSSVNMTATSGSSLLKGDEFGYFLFGGSDIIVLYQAGAKPRVDQGTQYRHFGSPIASCERR
ncbi:MAG: phosphatidylserine decarboxylase [Planctomycetaceae bacterium]